MIAQLQATRSPAVIPFPTLVNPVDPDWPFEPDKPVTLRAWYEKKLLPEISDQAPRSLNEDRVALNHWERFTGNPDIRETTKTHLEQLLEGLKARGVSEHTANKTWRELKAIFEDAAELHAIPAVPCISRKRKGSLVKVSKVTIPRETLTLEDVERLWKGCRKATYPRNQEFPAPKLWRVAIVLFYTYGARTLDILEQLEQKNLRWSDRIIQFQAMKTSKLQGLPMTDVVEKQLRSICGRSSRLFAGFNTTGHFNKKRQRWKPGFYTTWRTEITADAGLPDVLFKHFRQSMVTRYNGLEDKLGSWIAGHFVPGVSAQNYDYPSARIRAAIEAAPVPPCFHEID